MCRTYIKLYAVSGREGGGSREGGGKKSKLYGRDCRTLKTNKIIKNKKIIKRRKRRR